MSEANINPSIQILTQWDKMSNRTMCLLLEQFELCYSKNSEQEMFLLNTLQELEHSLYPSKLHGMYRKLFNSILPFHRKTSKQDVISKLIKKYRVEPSDLLLFIETIAKPFIEFEPQLLEEGRVCIRPTMQEDVRYLVKELTEFQHVVTQLTGYV